MDVNLITMPQRQAREKLAEYRKSVREVKRREQRRSFALLHQIKEDEMMVKSLREISRGNKLIDLFAAFEVAQRTKSARYTPVLAIAKVGATRVQCKQCTSYPFWGQWVRFTPASGCDPDKIEARKRKQLWSRHKATFSIPRQFFPNLLDNNRFITATVPNVPPALRPVDFIDGGYHILWEANWNEPPRDPMLLRHLCDRLFVVLAVWDLTEAERAVVGLRRSN